jgi:hypothetical protein
VLAPGRADPAFGRVRDGLKSGRSVRARSNVRLVGSPVRLAAYSARTTTNRQFVHLDLSWIDRLFLPLGSTGLLDAPALSVQDFLEDDHRGAVSPEPVARLDGADFHLSVKGVGSTVDPFSHSPLDPDTLARLTDDPEVRHRLSHPSVPPAPGEADRFITGEVWLRGSPYGGQGLEHATTALAVSERAELTSIEGFRIAPVVKVAHFPVELEERLRSLHWFRRFRGPIVQELRLVPSNVRIYFHARSTIGTGVREVFDRFGVDSERNALEFERAFLQSTVPLLTLFARTLRYDPNRDRYFGLDFHDVWLDKDAVVAPDGQVYFVDLEGIEEEGVERERVKEKIEDQVYRSLYEFLFAFEQIDGERQRRFGGASSRKEFFVALLERALAMDRYVRVRTSPRECALEIRNSLGDEGLITRFPLVDR